MNVRKINKKERLLEFYVSKYPDEYNRTSRLFLSSIKKVIEGNRQSFLELDEIEFVSYKTIGVEDFMLFKYNNITFDKIVEFNGFLVIKFKCDVVINGVDILEVHMQKELEEKYKNKTKK
jgi:hypothetical protein